MMAQPNQNDLPAASAEKNRASDHLANERTFLAWVRTGVAIVVFGFAIAIRQLAQIQGPESRTARGVQDGYTTKNSQHRYRRSGASAPG